jgi:prepilin-type N-terminal cleavage/methylation domain-containing protein
MLNLSSQNSWFTLTELLIVIAILGILGVGILTLDFRGLIGVQKEEQFTGWVTALLREEIAKSIAGRGIPVAPGSTELAFPSETRIILSSGSIQTEYLSGTTIVSTGRSFTKPFFGEPNSKVASLSGVLMNGTVLGEVATQPSEAIVISLANGRDMGLTYSGAGIAWCPSGGCALVKASIALESRGRVKILTIDRRSWLIELQ